MGIPRLRRAISHWYRHRYGVAIDADKAAIVTICSKEGLAHLMLATLDRGDTVLVPDPSYPIHIYGAVIAGADSRSIPLIPGVDFFEELEKAICGSYPKPKMMVLGFPGNPTAQCVALDFFERVVALARKHQILVVYDLAYAEIVFDSWQAPSTMQVPGAKDLAVEFFTLSKSYNMVGWRIGCMVGNADLVHALAGTGMRSDGFTQALFETTLGQQHRDRVRRLEQALPQPRPPGRAGAGAGGRGCRRPPLPGAQPRRAGGRAEPRRRLETTTPGASRC